MWVFHQDSPPPQCLEPIDFICGHSNGGKFFSDCILIQYTLLMLYDNCSMHLESQIILSNHANALGLPPYFKCVLALVQSPSASQGVGVTLAFLRLALWLSELSSILGFG
jgi:hypothetical protein